MTTHIPSGNPIPLSVLLFDLATDKFVQAVIVDETGSQIAGSPVAISHVLTGLYEFNGLVMPDVDYVTAIFTVYDDALFTIPSQIHCPSAEQFIKDNDSSVILEKIDTLSRRAIAVQPITVQTSQDLIIPVTVFEKIIPVIAP